MIILSSTNDILEVLTTAAISLDYYVSYVDITTTAFTPGQSNGNIITATTTTVLTAPGASTQRQVKYVTLRNRGTAAQGVTVKFDVSATERYISPSVTLSAGEVLQYTGDLGWQILDANGGVKTRVLNSTTISGYSSQIMKVGTAPEAAGNQYCHSKDAGFPGAWVPGTPGLAGRTTDGTTTTDAGCVRFVNAVSGSIYLSGYTLSSSVTGLYMLHDVLWVNSGIVVTTTTAQTINSVAWPARDINGSTNGDQVGIGLLVTTATTNAALNSTMTMSYTNSEGTAGRTATVGTGTASFPATAVIGTFVPFLLAAGDRGVRSIQTITLATSLTAGAVSIVAYRPIVAVGVTLVNTGGVAAPIAAPGIKCYSGTCLLPFDVASATTAQTIVGEVYFTEQ